MRHFLSIGEVATPPDGPRRDHKCAARPPLFFPWVHLDHRLDKLRAVLARLLDELSCDANSHGGLILHRVAEDRQERDDTSEYKADDDNPDRPVN